MKVTYLESPEGLFANSSQWQQLAQQVVAESPDVFVTNEMPFGHWLAAANQFDAADAQDSVAAHDDGLACLQALGIPLILSSKPVLLENKLANEAFALAAGRYQFAHQKHSFPNEPGFYETAWFGTRQQGFEVRKTPKLNVGVLLCTEVMFNEWARQYGRQGAHLIVVPRATGQTVAHWKTACAMAAVVSGCYVVSSNRVGQYDAKLTFGGVGFAFAPDGTLISQTSKDKPVVSFDLDINKVVHQQQEYPCYVLEPHLAS